MIARLAVLKNYYYLVDYKYIVAFLSLGTYRNSLKTSHYRNFKTFVNHFRILYAMRLIDENYLDKHTTNSLSVDSGYKSPVTFFRAFKLQTNQTPIVYSNCNV